MEQQKSRPARDRDPEDVTARKRLPSSPGAALFLPPVVPAQPGGGTQAGGGTEAKTADPAVSNGATATAKRAAPPAAFLAAPVPNPPDDRFDASSSPRWTNRPPDALTNGQFGSPAMRDPQRSPLRTEHAGAAALATSGPSEPPARQPNVSTATPPRATEPAKPAAADGPTEPAVASPPVKRPAAAKKAAKKTTTAKVAPPTPPTSAAKAAPTTTPASKAAPAKSTTPAPAKKATAAKKAGLAKGASATARDDVPVTAATLETAPAQAAPPAKGPTPAKAGPPAKDAPPAKAAPPAKTPATKAPATKAPAAKAPAAKSTAAKATPAKATPAKATAANASKAAPSRTRRAATPTTAADTDADTPAAATASAATASAETPSGASPSAGTPAADAPAPVADIADVPDPPSPVSVTDAPDTTTAEATAAADDDSDGDAPTAVIARVAASVGSRLWITIRKQPEHAPGAVALAIVAAHADEARSGAEWLRRTYPDVDAGRLARVAIRTAERRTRLAALATALPLGGMATATAQVWAYGRLVLDIAAVYRFDPGAPERAADILALLGAYPDVNSARAAVRGVTGESPDDGRRPPALPKFGGAVSALVRRAASHVVPASGVVLASLAGATEVADLGERTIRYYRDAADERDKSSERARATR